MLFFNFGCSGDGRGAGLASSLKNANAKLGVNEVEKVEQTVQTAGTWNGIVGALELRAEAPVWIDDLQLFPDIENKMVQVKGSIGNLL